MLASRALHHINHSHDHGHGHHHNAISGNETISLKSLLSLGVAGGIVPCPSALVVLLLSLTFHRVAEGLVLIIFFSLGLASVLILIGILTVTASQFAGRFGETRAWIQRLPVLSAGFIMIIGIIVVFNSFLAAGMINIRV
ncbi:MAG: hypothetical protein GY729_06145 [Desulfobacteraceae bacterium]|nr:hypothetical protein [Desulfobacteraceae bacterium]